MAQVRVRIDEGSAPQPLLLWDSVWQPTEGTADWELATVDEPLNSGGLRAREALPTAVVLALFTDLRCPDEHPLRWLAEDDLRGWWGDGVDVRDDIGEAPLGSLLWLLERAPLTFEIASLWAPIFINDALAPLLNQGAVVRIEVETLSDELKSRLDAVVRLYGRDGQKIYDQKFGAIWSQIGGVARR